MRNTVLSPSALPPLSLPHELELFGGTFQVYVSTGCTFSPDTLTRAVADSSWDSMLRQQAPGYHLSMRKFVYAVTGRHQASEGTKKLLVKEFAGFMDADLMHRALSGEEVHYESTSSWHDVLRGLADGGGVLNDIATCFAACDLHVMEVTQSFGKDRRGNADAYFTSLFGQGISAWRDINPAMGMQVAILVDVGLKALAWLEHRLVTRAGDSLKPRSATLPLLRPQQRPIGNWLDEVLTAAKCKRLPELEKRLAAEGVRHLKRPITADLLRKWSAASTRLMPRTGMQAVVGVLRTEDQRQLARSRWYVARYLTFLGALVRAGTAGPRPECNEVQEWLAERLKDAYELQRQAPAA